MKTLIKVKFGSHLYGTNTPESDTDFKAVHVPSGKEILLQNYPKVISNSTGSQNIKNNRDDVDDESYSIIKYLDMIRSGDMIAYEMLFVNPGQAIHFDKDWDRLFHKNRYKLIDKNISGFVGYIRQQANKYGIKGSRIATARAAVEMFDRLCFAVSVNREKTKLNDFDPKIFEEFCRNNPHSQIVMLPMSHDNEQLTPYIEILNRKIDYRVKVNDAYKIMKKLFDEYGSRAIAAESNQGVDWKALYHAIRVSEQAIQLLVEGEITFPRSNVTDLLKIKYGEYKYREVSERLENNLATLENLMLTSSLEEKYDNEYINEIIEELHLNAILQRKVM